MSIKGCVLQIYKLGSQAVIITQSGGGGGDPGEFSNFQLILIRIFQEDIRIHRKNDELGN